MLEEYLHKLNIFDLKSLQDFYLEQIKIKQEKDKYNGLDYLVDRYRKVCIEFYTRRGN